MKTKRLLTVLILSTFYFLLSTSSVWAIFEERPSSARAWGMGGAFTAVADDSSAIYFNPAGLGQLKMIELSGSYTTLYGEKDLEYKVGSIALPLGRLGTIGLATTNYGHRQLREDAYIFSAGRKFTFEKQEIYLGGNAKYLRLEIETVGKEFDYGGDLGLLYKLLDGKLSLGLFGGNINTPHIGDDLPQRYAGGIAYRPNSDLTLAIDYHCEKQEEEENDEFRVGVEYHWLKYLFLRSGVANNPGRWMVGWGLKNRFLSFDYAYLPHHNLDETHLGTLTFRFGGPRKKIEGARVEEEARRVAEEVETKRKEEEIPPIIKVVPEKVIEKININTATRSQLETLPGIGPAKTLAIIAHRPYERIEDLRSVPGIGAKRYEALKDLITIEPEKVEEPEKVPIPEEEVEVPAKLEEKSSEARILILPSEEVPLEEEKPLAPEVIPEEVVPPKVEEEVSKPVVEEITHTVVKGDTLSKIAKRYLGDVKRYKEIAEYNGIKAPYLIHPGEMIRIPH